VSKIWVKEPNFGTLREEEGTRKGSETLRSNEQGWERSNLPGAYSDRVRERSQRGRGGSRGGGKKREGKKSLANGASL